MGRKLPAAVHIELSAEEDRTLSELRVATTVPQRIRDRAHMLRLNAQGWTHRGHSIALLPVQEPFYSINPTSI